MPRTINVPLNTYQPGNYGPYNINGFNANNTDTIQLYMTVEADWPDVPIIATVIIETDNGAKIEVNVPGRPKNKDKTPMSVFAPSVGLPWDTIGNNAPVKRGVAGASASAIVYEPFSTAITLTAV
jgi:hypothetical protein